MAAFADVLALDVDVIAVDMPMGLLDSGPRSCDVAARAALGVRRSSVFPAPARAVLGSATYAEALARSRATHGKGLSVQAFNLVRRIEEVDRLVGPDDQARVVEASPELSFAVLAGAPLSESKRTSPGRSQRLRLLETVFTDVARRLAEPHPGAAADDVLDAYAVAWTARRVASGSATRMGAGEQDSRGLRCVVQV
jgi:predicted RNase H-like nuclease